MNKSLKLITAIFTAILITSCSEKSIENFPNLKWGMTPQQVAKFFPINNSNDYSENEFTDEEVNDPNSFAPEVDYQGEQDLEAQQDTQRLEKVSTYICGSWNDMLIFTFNDNKLFQIEQAYSFPQKINDQKIQKYKKNAVDYYEEFQDWSPFDAETESVFTQITTKNGILSLVDGSLVSEKLFDYKTYSYIFPEINKISETHESEWTTEKYTDKETGCKYFTFTSKKSETGAAVFIGIQLNSDGQLNELKSGIITPDQNQPAYMDYTVDSYIPYTIDNWKWDSFVINQNEIYFYSNAGQSDHFSADKYIIRYCLENDYLTLTNSQQEAEVIQIDVSGLYKTLKNCGIDLLTISNWCRVAFG